MEEVNKVTRYNEVLESFIDRGCGPRASLSFVANNIDEVLQEGDKISTNSFFIYNNEQLYGVLVVDRDSYKWSVLINQQFSKLKGLDDLKDDCFESDYIVEMMIHSCDMPKVQKIIPEITEMDVEGKIKTMKKIGLNSRGYHFK